VKNKSSEARRKNDTSFLQGRRKKRKRDSKLTLRSLSENQEWRMRIPKKKKEKKRAATSVVLAGEERRKGGGGRQGRYCA